ncbi:MAG: hypothetical protein ACP5DZ_02160 [Bacteroidales bacterium]
MMKNKRLLPFLALILFPLVLSAQTTDKLNLVDSRVLNAYSVQEIQSMPEYKIYQVNYLYADSYRIPLTMKNKIDPMDIDISKYGAFRHDSKEQKVYINPEKTTGPYIILKSKAEVREQLAIIKEQHQK